MIKDSHEFKSNRKDFVKELLDDVKAFEYMLENNYFEDDIVRIGAEQELIIIDKKNLRPKPIAATILNEMKEHKYVVPEIAKFNLECNMSPQPLVGSCFSDMEKETRGFLETIQGKLHEHGADLILTGVLPTLRKYELGLHNLTEKDRYRAIIDAIKREHNGKDGYELRLTGVDEMLVKHDSALLEACNNSFQFHLQVSPNNFVKTYNIVQALTPAIIAMAANSPIVFGKRLWHESRIALFQQALDTRSSQEHLRERMPRVSFGTDWLQDSVLEIFKEDISRFRMLLAEDIRENAFEQLEKGITPKLRALLLHNSTVYRWNRPCYGISPNGKPHLRIENRVMPAGPSIVDQIANSAFWVGCVKGLEAKYDDITQHFDSFVDVRDNFAKAARFGIDSKFTWMEEKKITAKDLILEELLPIAKEGLESQGVDAADIKKYLDIIKGRVSTYQTGARWQLRAYTKLLKHTDQDEALTCLTGAIYQNQKEDKPIHEWTLPSLNDLLEYLPAHMKIEDFMTTDLFTIQKDDPIELVAEMMNWRKQRYMAVEDDSSLFVGILSEREIVRYFLDHKVTDDDWSVKDIMLTDVPTILPSNSILEAIQTIEESKVSCLPVVTKKQQLVGIITESNFMSLSRRLIKRAQ